MRRKRSSPEAQAAKRTQKAVKRGGDSRSSTVYVDPTEGGKARHGHVDRLSFNYGHAEGGKPRRGDLRGLRVRRRREGDSFEPDQPSSDYHRTVSLPHRANQAPRRARHLRGRLRGEGVVRLLHRPSYVPARPLRDDGHGHHQRQRPPEGTWHRRCHSQPSSSFGPFSLRDKGGIQLARALLEAKAALAEYRRALRSGEPFPQED